MAKSAYVYYSGPTDKTGTAIAEALKAGHGKKLPNAIKTDVCICWGCKTKEKTNTGKMDVLNHPDKIRDNRNKFKTLQTLKNAKVAVGDFCSASDVMKELDNKKSMINLPLIGRTNYHQGGKGFWTCMTRGQVKTAVDQGAQYFQNYMAIVTEYRLHVFKDRVINHQKKTPRNNMAEAYQEQHADRIVHNAKKKGVTLDEQTLNHVLGDLGKRQENPDQIIKSNTRGWKFSQVKSVKKPLEDIAIAAVKAIGLDFGAVDCCELEDGSVAIIEVNTGPGLAGTSFEAYIEAFKKHLAPAPKKVVAKAKAVGASAPVSTPTSAKTGSKKKVDPNALRTMADLLEHADDEEADAINSVFKKMLG